MRHANPMADIRVNSITHREQTKPFTNNGSLTTSSFTIDKEKLNEVNDQGLSLIDSQLMMPQTFKLPIDPTANKHISSNNYHDTREQSIDDI